MSPELINGSGKEIHENVLYIKGSVSRLESSIDSLSHNVEKLSVALEKNNDSAERIIVHMANALPLKFVVLICLIICMAFIGGGFLKEITDGHILLKLFGAM